ncbi:MAG: VWA domain-containing protein, partial [Myxococcales bacterium]|nr:VWA domain-containing protein [Myxococcales bacterium]
MKSKNLLMATTGLLLMGSVTAIALSKSPEPPPYIESFLPHPELQAPAPIHIEQGPLSLDFSFDETMVLYGDNDATALLEVRASEDANTQRTPVSMTIVMDVSGSMSGTKIANSREAARSLVSRLAPGDLLTLVSFNNQSNLRLSNQEIGEDRSNIYAVIDSLAAGGGTCITCGLDTAYSNLASVPSSHTSRVILMSDGQGQAPASQLQASAAAALRNHGTPTASIGLGGDVNTQAMSAIAEGGAATYYFMHNSGMMDGILGSELAAL